ncbi:MAG: Flp pilus assembly complex ATPase component TadA [Planctomycetaceae bacterium]|nr:Flp pilus assembly complex ATPase component TadA [Planctomycetaceae bacterium]MCA9110414.1 Flp pilus assembly complex ATPase component TadA [Planctomycetaceae bacterium]
MVFGFGKSKSGGSRRDYDSSEEFEIESILFQGALNGKEVDLRANAKLAQAGLVPAKELISDALARRADMIRLDPKGRVAAVTLYVDGVPFPGSRMPAQQALAITQMLKLLAGLDIRDRQNAQAGGIVTDYKETPYHLLINTSPLKAGGERLVVRPRNQQVQLETPDDLGFSEDLRVRIRELTSHRRGVVLVCGPPNSGVTTLSFAVIRSIDAYLYSIYSLADFGGRSITHISQAERVEGETFDRQLARAIRSDADVIIVEPLHEEDRLKIVFDDATKVCIVAEYKAPDAGNCITQLRDTLGAEIVSDRLAMVLSQKLIRLLCDECKQAYRPNPRLLQKVGLPPETKVLYRPPQPIEGEEPDECYKCGSIGYFGRTGVIQAIEVNDSIKELIKSGADASALKNQARREGMQSFQSDGLRLVAEGKTSLEELQRAFKA